MGEHVSTYAAALPSGIFDSSDGFRIIELQ